MRPILVISLLTGVLGEYNGKFMSSQLRCVADPVLRPKSTSEPATEIFSIQQIAGNSAGYV